MNNLGIGLSWLALAALAMPCARAEPAKDYPPAWPRPGATLLVENDRGAAYDVTYVTGQPTPMHRHRYFSAGMDLNTATIKVTQPDGSFHVGPVIGNDMWYLPKGLVHQEMYTTDPPGHVLIVDIKEKHLPEAVNTTKFPVNKYATYQRKVVDNDRVIIWDCAWSPGAEAAPSFDSRDIFLAFAQGGDLAIESPGKPATTAHYGTGQAIFLKGGEARTIRSTGGTIHAMLVELK